MAYTGTVVRIGPADHGRRMSLDDFRDAEVVPGYTYELAQGVIDVVDVPSVSHARVTDALHRQLDRYRESHPERITLMASGSECRVEAPAMVSERHPDRAIYLSPQPDVDPPWADWTPEIVIEVVSKGGEHRDYHEKRQDYLAAGVQEYWIVDPQASTMLALTRRGDTWKEQCLNARGVYLTRLLPGFELRLDEVLSSLERR